MMKMIVVSATLALTSLVAWIIWGQLLGFLISLIPESAEYAWMGKIIIVLGVGYFGGIAIPIAIFVVGLYITFLVDCWFHQEEDVR